jgi:integrase
MWYRIEEAKDMPRRRDGIYHRKDGRWEARYVKEVDLTGKKKYGSVYGHSYKEAREKRQDVLAHIVLYQKPPSARRLTVKELATEWLLVNQTRLKPSTCQRYQGVLKNHLEGSLGAMEVLYVTTVTIHQFSAEKLSSGLAPQTVNAILTLFHSILKYGQRQYQLPVPEIIYLTCEKKEMRVLSQAEQKKLVAYLMQEPDPCKLGVLVALYTGLRVGELCALKWEDISKDSITVRRTMQRLKTAGSNSTELHIGSPKTKTSLRTIPLPTFLRELIEPYRTAKLAESYFLASSPDEVIEPRNMQYRFRRYLKEASIEQANFHALRHTFATRCVEAGFEIKSLSEILGHANVQTTLNKYVHSSFDLKRANMELLSLIL